MRLQHYYAVLCNIINAIANAITTSLCGLLVLPQQQQHCLRG
jgi:hypothetical protein